MADDEPTSPHGSSDPSGWTTPGQGGWPPQPGQPTEQQPAYPYPTQGYPQGYPPGYGPYGHNPYASGPPPTAKPNNYLGWSIAITLLCCWPLGIPAIVFAAKVDNLWNQGQWAEAEEASRKARMFMIASAVAGLVVGILYAVVILATATKTPTTRYR